jgi:hypothetical protein
MLRVLSPGSSTEPNVATGLARLARLDSEAPTAPVWRRILDVTIVATLVAEFVTQVRYYAFIGDDAFISFRYLGLVDDRMS